MSWQDRDYSQDGYQVQGGRMMGGGFRFPSVTPMVKKLLIANIAVFVAQIIFQRSRAVDNIGAFVFEQAVYGVQLWRFVSYQYLHGGAWHLFFNMIGLYFLGSLLERSWGQRKFFLLYTLFGVAGATLYAMLVGFDVLPNIRMIGASGSVLGLIGACAVAAPQIRLLLFFVFPVRIRTVAVIFAAIYALNVMSSQNGADACHLGGLAVGALWAWLEAKGIIRWSGGRVEGSVGPTGRKWVQVKIRQGAWERKMKNQQAQQIEIDRILKKVHERGLNSLSRQEKKVLQQASQEKA